jgi:endoglucanase
MPFRSRRRTLLTSIGVILLACLAAVMFLVVSGSGGAAHRAHATRAWQDAQTNHQVFPGGLWVNPGSLPAEEEQLLSKEGDVTAAALVQQIASQPIAVWLTGPSSRTALLSTLHRDLAEAKLAGKTPVFVLYAIPDRDCGNYSAGGFPTNASYLSWSETIARTLRGHPAVVLMEPDSIAMLGRSSCTSITKTRLHLLDEAVRTYSRDHIDVYLDGGNSHWQKASVMATRLREAGVKYARGFFTNVSNFYGVDPERAYADRLSGMLGGAHFVIDVSRDGPGWAGSWCNPDGAALGQNPHITLGDTPLDALLWVKTPGASDGTCNGGPAAGRWYQSYALSLVTNREAHHSAG